MPRPLDEAIAYVRRKWSPVPIPPGEKGPRIKEWPKLRIVEATAPEYFKVPGFGIGIILGEASNWLADVDLDCPEAVELASQFLPPTGAVFGRSSKQRSHWLYYARNVDTLKIEDNRTVVVELRSNGLQTMFPGSVHPGGEPVEWSSNGEPSTVGADELELAVKMLAEAAKLVRAGWSADAACALAREGRVEQSPAVHTRVRSESNFSEAVERYNAANRLDIPRSGGECPGCGHRGCFGRLPGDDQRWYCFSSGHDAPGLRGRCGYHGDALDLGAHALGLTRAEVLRRNGYLRERSAAPSTQQDRSAGALPEIKCGVDIERMADEALAALAKSGVDVYHRGGALAHVVTDESRIGGVERIVGTPRIEDIPPPRLLELVASAARWVKQETRGKKSEDGEEREWKPSKPDRDAVAAAASRGRWPMLRRLAGVVETPVLRPDGTVLDEPGYDASTELVYRDGAEAIEVPKNPTDLDAQRAVSLLLEAVGDFPFAGEEYRSAWLAYLLTPFARYAFDGPVPLFLVDANTRGSGKSLLADIVGIVACGRRVPRMPPTDDEAEERKRLTAIAMAGDRMVLIDNVTKALGTAALDSVLTSARIRDRKLGETGMVEAEVRTVFAATGNNVELASDMVRRVCHIRIESPHEKPEERSDFKHPDILAWVTENRGELAGAALTLLAAYTRAGRPVQQVKAWGSYEGWNRLVAQCVVWAGLPDPNKTREELSDQADQERYAGAALLKSLKTYATYGTTIGDMLEDVAANADEHRLLKRALADFCGGKGGELPSARSVAARLKRLKGRVIAGMTLETIGTDSEGQRKWSVRETRR